MWKTFFMNQIYSTIKTLRKERNISRADISKALGMGEMSYGKIERGEVSINIERLYDLADIFNMPPEEILTYNGNEYKPKPIPKGNITYVPIKAQAGYLSELLDDVNADDCISFDLPFFRGGNLYMIDIEGDSMNPTINHGDYAVVSKTENTIEVQYGKPYMIESRDGRVIKRIYSYQEDDKLKLVSDNDIYEPYLILKDSILSIWEVKGFVSKDLSPRNIYQKRLQAIETNLHEVSKYIQKA